MAMAQERARKTNSTTPAVQAAHEPPAPQPRSTRAGPAHAGGALVRMPGIQTKLTVGQAGDRFEKEADHVADRVTSGQPAGEISRIPAGGLGAQRQPDESAQAKCDGCARE